MVEVDYLPSADHRQRYEYANRKWFGQCFTCGDCSVAHKSELIEILEFTHFFEHFTFDKTDYSERGKHMKKYIRVVVAVELVTVGAKIEPTS